MARTYEYVCPFCKRTKTTDRKPPAGLSCGDNAACNEAHNAAVRQWHIDNPRTRTPRKRTTGAVGDGSWAFVGALNGYRTKGSNNGGH